MSYWGVSAYACLCTILEPTANLANNASFIRDSIQDYDADGESSDLCHGLEIDRKLYTGDPVTENVVVSDFFAEHNISTMSNTRQEIRICTHV